MKTVNVDLGERSYPIYVQSGLLNHLHSSLKSHDVDQRIFIITDENVHKLYGDKVLNQLNRAGFEVQLLTVPAGEKSKSLQQANELYTQMLRARADRNSFVVALGGGVVGDLAGFVASTFMRGIPFIQVPTTILAQVDSSVGGKVGVNHELGKNLIGAFYQPQFVLIDPDTIQTLPARQIRAGCAEILKYGFIQDRKFYDRCANGLDALFDLSEPELLEYALYTSCEIKADVVSQDEKEAGLRATLNFGHTVGHAVEAVTGYDEFLHGEAIVHGMIAALALSREKGWLDDKAVEGAVAVLERFQPPALPADLNFDSLMTAMQKDKKRSSAGQLWVLLQDIGSSVLTRDVEEQHVKRAIEFMLSRGARS